MISASQIDATAARSIEQLAKWLEILNVGGTKVSTLRRSAVGTYGDYRRRLRRITFEVGSFVDLVRWALEQRRAARKTPWLYYDDQ